MSRKPGKQTRRPDAAVPPPPAEELFDPAEMIMTDGEREDIDHFFAEFPSTCWVQIQRVQPNGERAVCETVPYEALSEDPGRYTRDKWGSGKYWFRLKNQKREFITSRTLIIAELFKPAAPPGAATTGNNDLVGFLRDELAASRALVNSMITSRGHGGPDIGQLISGLGAFLKPPDTAQIMASMAATFQALRPKEQSRDALAEARGLIELAEKIGGGKGSTPDDWPAVVREVGGKLAEKLGPGLLSGSGSGHGQNVGSPVPQAAEPHPEGDVSVEQDFYDSVSEAVSFLARKQQTRSIDFWAAWIVESRDERNWAALLHAIRIGGTVDQLFDLAPQLRENPQTAQWFRDLYVALKHAIESAQPPAAPAG